MALALNLTSDTVVASTNYNITAANGSVGFGAFGSSTGPQVGTTSGVVGAGATPSAPVSVTAIPTTPLAQAIAGGTVVNIGGVWFTVGADLGTTSTDMPSGTAVTSIALTNPLTAAQAALLVPGTTIVVGGTDFTVATAPNAGDSSIAVQSLAPTADIPSGSTVLYPGGAAQGATSIPVFTEAVTAPIASGAVVLGPLGLGHRLGLGGTG